MAKGNLKEISIKVNSRLTNFMGKVYTHILTETSIQENTKMD